MHFYAHLCINQLIYRISINSSYSATLLLAACQNGLFSSSVSRKTAKRPPLTPFSSVFFTKKPAQTASSVQVFGLKRPAPTTLFFCHFSLHHLPHLPTYFTYFPRSPARPDLQSSRSEYKDFQSAYTVHFAFVTPWVYRIANANIQLRRIANPAELRPDSVMNVAFCTPPGVAISSTPLSSGST